MIGVILSGFSSIFGMSLGRVIRAEKEVHDDLDDGNNRAADP